MCVCVNDFSLYHRTQKKRKCEDDGATSNGKPTTTTENEVCVCVCVLRVLSAGGRLGQW